MRMTSTLTIAAAALLTAAPAWAQNATAPANTTGMTAANTAAMNAATGNEMGGTTTSTANTTTATETATVPVEANAAGESNMPAQEEKKGFPWGALGLLGLLGLIPRMRRR